MKSTPPTTDELLRLARKAKPDFEWEVIGEPGEIDACVMAGDATLVDVVCHARAREALHAALLVLAGELDVAELLAERDKLHAYIERVRDAALSCGGAIAPISQVLMEDP